MYEDFYHLRAKPFRLSPDHRFFFASRGHKQALAYLRYGLSQDEGFIVITGAPGTGKTTLAQILLKEINQSDVVVAHLTTTQLDADEMLCMIAASFGLHFEGVSKPALIKVLENFLLAQSRAQKRVLLVVDEAQNLPPRSIEELRMLSNLQVGDKALLQTFLLGQTQFHQMLKHRDLEQFRQRVIASYHLKELGEDECQQYIESRLRHVDWQDDPHFTSVAYKKIYQYAQGIPRRINILCDRLMLFGFLEETHEIDEALLQRVTDELKQEISGQPESENDDDLLRTQDSLYADFHQPSDQVEVKKPAASDVLKELEVEDKHSAYSANQNDVDNPLSNTDIDDSSMCRVMPEDGYENIVAQNETGKIAGEEKNWDANQVTASATNLQLASKDRFHVVSGGRNRDEVSNLSAGRANKPALERSTSVTTDANDSEVVLRKILRLVLAYHRSPRSFPGLEDPTQPLPKGITQILTLAVSDDDVLENLRQIAVMGITPAVLRDAVRFFIRRVMFIDGGDDCRVLGLPANNTQQQVEEHFDLLTRIVRQEKRRNKKETEEVSLIRKSYESLYQDEIKHATHDTSNEEIDNDLDLDLSPDWGSPKQNTASKERGAYQPHVKTTDDELDIDLSPEGPESRLARESSTDQLSNIITSDQRTAQYSRNIILISGSAVIVFILYLTQYMSTGEPDVSVDVAGSKSVQQPVEPTRQDVVATAAVALSNNMNPSSRVTAEVMASPEVENELGTGSGLQQQRIMAELSAKIEAAEVKAENTAREEAEAIEHAKRDAELKRVAEERARQEKLARIELEAMARAAKQAEAEIKAAKKSKRELARAREKLRKAAKATRKKTPPPVATKQATQGTNASRTKVTNAQPKKGTVVQSSPDSARISNLNSIVDQFENAYAAGNLETLVSLFATKARTNDQPDLKSIRKGYQAFFDNTSSRKISLLNMNWELKDNYARGVGGYEIDIRNTGARSNVKYSGSITIELRQSAKHLQISGLYFNGAMPVRKAVKKAKTLASIGELKQVLENFSSAYSRGDIPQFMALFSADARTNDQSTLQGIRDDYTGLFAGSEFRQIEFSAMQWQREGGISRGEGRYVVKVQPKGNEEIDVYRGKLGFNIKRHDDKLLITYFYFK